MSGNMVVLGAVKTLECAMFSISVKAIFNAVLRSQGTHKRRSY